MSAMTMLSTGNKWNSYSGVTFGDVSVPATIQLIFIPNTGLKDSYVKIQPFFGQNVSTAAAMSVGILVKIDDVEIIKAQDRDADSQQMNSNGFDLFVPRQSKLEILSLNTSGNNTQERGVNILGYYL